MAIWGGDDGDWKEAQEIWAGDDGDWKKAQKVWVGDGGDWKLAFEVDDGGDTSTVKELSVTDDGGFTFTRAIKLWIRDGDESKTGTDWIELDFSEISDDEDLGVYDENDNEVDHYFEKFDTDDDKEIFMWVHKEWVRDGSVQLKLKYGNGPYNTSVDGTTLFSKDSNLNGCWLFQDTSDFSGEGNDITDQENVELGYSTSRGPCAEFSNDTDAYLEVDDQSSNQLTDYITIYAWLYVDQFPNSQFESCGVFNKWGDDASYVLDFDESGVLRFIVQDTDENNNIAESDSGKIGTGDWYFMAATADVDSGEAKVYLDGNEEDSVSFSDIRSSNFPPLIGVNAGKDLDEHFIGEMNELMLYNDALSGDELKAIYDASKYPQDFFDQSAAS